MKAIVDFSKVLYNFFKTGWGAHDGGYIGAMKVVYTIAAGMAAGAAANLAVAGIVATLPAWAVAGIVVGVSIAAGVAAGWYWDKVGELFGAENVDASWWDDVSDYVRDNFSNWWDRFNDWVSEEYSNISDWLKEKADEIASLWDDFNDWLSENRFLDPFFDWITYGHLFRNNLDPELNELYLKSRHLVPINPLVIDPLVLDLDGDGKVSTVGLNGYDSVLFDHDGDGVKTATGWVAENDGLLVIDKNGNGVIDNGLELFGADYVKQDGTLAMNGFDALADLDANEDGVVDAEDAAFNQVKVWRDLNQDGISQANELFSLAELGIASIDLGATAVSESLANGNSITATASYTRADGATGLVANLDLAENPFYREFEEEIYLSEETNLLPNMQGSGGLRDLREAVNERLFQEAA
jgi:hypothetical protein